MRGKVPRQCTQAQDPGITPAYAGKRKRAVVSSRRCQDHPRLCGEKMHFFLAGSGCIGSPPPMRGKAPFLSPRIIIPGITPAYAGKSRSRGNAACARKDHPRLCGDKNTLCFRHCVTTGSPPPMRGKGTVRGKNTRPWRITPAYAGKS